MRVLVSRIPRDITSDRRIEDSVEIVSKLVGVDKREPPASSDDHVDRHWFPPQWPQFSDGFSRASDREPLTFGSAVDHLATMVAQLADRHL